MLQLNTELCINSMLLNGIAQYLIAFIASLRAIRFKLNILKKFKHKGKKVGQMCAQFFCVYCVQLLRNCAQVKATCVGNPTST